MKGLLIIYGPQHHKLLIWIKCTKNLGNYFDYLDLNYCWIFLVYCKTYWAKILSGRGRFLGRDVVMAIGLKGEKLAGEKRNFKEKTTLLHPEKRKTYNF